MAIGVVPQEVNFDPFFPPRELLELQAGLYGVPPAERKTMEILEAVGLADKADAPSRTLSGGMRRRLLVAKAMVHSPPILVLDEPTAGVDIELRHQLWEHVKAMNRRGTTIVLTTHYLEEAEELCDRIAIIDKGQVVACDTTQALLHRLDNKTLNVVTRQPVLSIPDALSRFEVKIADKGHGLSITYHRSTGAIAEILGVLTASGLDIEFREAGKLTDAARHAASRFALDAGFGKGIGERGRTVRQCAARDVKAINFNRAIQCFDIDEIEAIR